jgi:hypothetical protein
MGEEGRPDAGQGEAQKDNYVQYYQGWQAQKPMNEEAEEVMAREGPTLEQREETYIRNMNNSIVHRLCTMLEIGDLEEIVRSVVELAHYWWQGVEFQEPVAKNREEPSTDEEAAARVDAIEFTNKAIEAEEKENKIKRDAHCFPLEEEDKMDYVDENKLRLYGDGVNKVTSKVSLHAKEKEKQNFKKLVAVTLRPMELARVKDKEV